MHGFMYNADEEMSLSAAADEALGESLGRRAIAEALAEAVAETLEGNPTERQLTWQPGLCGFSLLPLDVFPGLPTAEWVGGRPCLVCLVDLDYHCCWCCC